MKKVLFLCNYFPPDHEAGDSIFARDFIFAIQRKFAAVAVAIRIPVSNKYEEFEEHGVKKIYLTTNWRNEFFCFIESFNPDFVCAFQVLSYQDLLLIRSRYNMPFIYFQQINFKNHLKYNGYNEIIEIYQRLENKIIKISDLIFCMSDDDYIETKKDNENVFRVDPGINFGHRLHLVKGCLPSNRSQKIKIGISGRLTDRTKGTDLLIKAINIMDVEVTRRAIFSFLGASDCNYFSNSLKKIISETEVNIIPWVKDEISYNRWLISNDVVVITSRYENVCLTAIEAISCGIPVVGTSVGYMEKYIINNLTGWLLPKPIIESDFVSVLARSLKSLIDCPEKAYSISKICQEYSRKRFDINLTVNAFMKIIDGI